MKRKEKKTKKLAKDFTYHQISTYGSLHCSDTNTPTRIDLYLNIVIVHAFFYLGKCMDILWFQIVLCFPLCLVLFGYFFVFRLNIDFWGFFFSALFLYSRKAWLRCALKIPILAALFNHFKSLFNVLIKTFLKRSLQT